jgi:hypothetical protein
MTEQRAGEEGKAPGLTPRLRRWNVMSTCASFRRVSVFDRSFVFDVQMKAGRRGWKSRAKNAIVTGAARGIGRGIATKLARVR